MGMVVHGRWALIWYCSACGAFVGCHEGTDVPLGLMADRDTRQARYELHKVFDRLWKKGPLARDDAYRWLASVLNLPPEWAHISMLSEEQCLVVQKALQTPPRRPRAGVDRRHWKEKRAPREKRKKR
jgi:hypothetical protein